MNETPVTVVGNVASDLRMRRFGPDDERVVGFRVASSERKWDREKQAWIDGDRFSAWVTCWRRLGDGVSGSLSKGDPVVVTGRLSVREYEVEGHRRYSTEIAATAVGPDLSRSTASVTRRRLTVVPGSGAGGAASDDAPPSATEDLVGGADASGGYAAGASSDASGPDGFDDADRPSDVAPVAVGPAF